MTTCEKCHWDEWNLLLKSNPSLDQKPVDTSSMEHSHYSHISVGKAAKELGVSHQMLIGLIKSGHIKGFAREGKTGRPAYRVSKADFETLKTKLSEETR